MLDRVSKWYYKCHEVLGVKTGTDLNPDKKRTKKYFSKQAEQFCPDKQKIKEIYSSIPFTEESIKAYSQNCKRYNSHIRRIKKM